MAIQRGAWSCTMLLLCLVQVMSMPTCHLQGNLLKIAHRLLRDMGGHFPAQCQQDYVIITIPVTAFNTSGGQQQRETRTVIQQTLKNFIPLFTDEDLPSRWDQRKINEFLELVYRLTEESHCVSSSLDDRSEILKSYFARLKGILTEKNSSVCAWEVVRKELLSTLQFILKNHSDSLE